MHKIIVVTSASRGFGRLASTALARAGHTVYASMHETTGRNAATAAEIGGFARNNSWRQRSRVPLQQCRLCRPYPLCAARSG